MPVAEAVGGQGRAGLARRHQQPCPGQHNRLGEGGGIERGQRRAEFGAQARERRHVAGGPIEPCERDARQGERLRLVRVAGNVDPADRRFPCLPRMPSLGLGACQERQGKEPEARGDGGVGCEVRAGGSERFGGAGRLAGHQLGAAEIGLDDRACGGVGIRLGDGVRLFQHRDRLERRPPGKTGDAKFLQGGGDRQMVWPERAAVYGHGEAGEREALGQRCCLRRGGDVARHQQRRLGPGDVAERRREFLRRGAVCHLFYQLARECDGGGHARGHAYGLIIDHGPNLGRGSPVSTRSGVPGAIK